MNKNLLIAFTTLACVVAIIYSAQDSSKNSAFE